MALAKTRLHVANDVEELNQMASELPKVLNAKAYLNTAENVFKKGQDFLSLGDEESAYIMFMRYVNIVQSIQRTSEFKNNQETFSKLINKNHQRASVDMIRSLRQSLRKRYEERHKNEMTRNQRQIDQDRDRLRQQEEQLANQRTAQDLVDASVQPAMAFQMDVDPVADYEDNAAAAADIEQNSEHADQPEMVDVEQPSGEPNDEPTSPSKKDKKKKSWWKKKE